MLNLTPADQWFPAGIEAVHCSSGGRADQPVEIVVRITGSGAVSGRFPREDLHEFRDEVAEWLLFLARSRSDVGTAPLAAWARAVAALVADACARA